MEEFQMARTTVQFKVFRGTFASWNTLFTRAAEFASTLSPEKLITISHSADHSQGVVTVWYRE
jgi:hypothetical protein